MIAEADYGSAPELLGLSIYSALRPLADALFSPFKANSLHLPLEVAEYPFFLPRLFGPTFAYWWELSFKPQMDRSDNWRTRHDIKLLHGFFCRRAAAESRQSDWNAWLTDGREEREKALRENQGSNIGEGR